MSTATFLNIMKCYQNFIDPELYRDLVRNGERLGEESQKGILRVVIAVVEKTIGKEAVQKTVREFQAKGKEVIHGIIQEGKRQVQNNVREVEKKQAHAEQVEAEKLIS